MKTVISQSINAVISSLQTAVITGSDRQKRSVRHALKYSCSDELTELWLTMVTFALRMTEKACARAVSLACADSGSSTITAHGCA